MLPKPEACRPCPLYGTGEGFVPDELRENAKVLILLQNPGGDEESGRRVVGYDERGKPLYESCTPTPTIGKTGHMMERTFLPLAGLSREDVSICNVLRCRATTEAGKKTNTMPTGDVLKQATEHCMKTYFKVPHATRLIVAQGAYAWRQMGGPGKIEKWRGYLAPGGFTVRRSPNGGLGGHEANRGEHPSHATKGQEVGFGPAEITIPVFGVIHLADLFRDAKMDVVSRKDWQKIPKVLAGTWPEPMLPSLQPSYVNRDVVMRWFDAACHADWIVCDTEYNERTKVLTILGVGYRGMEQVLQMEVMHTPPEVRNSVYARFISLAASRPMVFQNALADVPVLRKALGIDWKDYYRIEDTMQAHAVLWCELKHDLEFLASLYGRYPKVKHLMHTEPLLYNAGDVLETDATWAVLDGELTRDPQSKKIYREHNMRLLEPLERSMACGIAVNAERVRAAFPLYASRIAAAVEVAQAYCGWPINVGSDDQVAKWLYEVEELPVQRNKDSRAPTVDQDAIGVLRGRFLPFDPDEDDTEATMFRRIEQGGHPLIEARVLHSAAAQIVSNYLNPLVEEM